MITYLYLAIIPVGFLTFSLIQLIYNTRSVLDWHCVLTTTMQQCKEITMADKRIVIDMHLNLV